MAQIDHDAISLEVTEHFQIALQHAGRRLVVDGNADLGRATFESCWSSSLTELEARHGQENLAVALRHCGLQRKY